MLLEFLLLTAIQHDTMRHHYINLRNAAMHNARLSDKWLKDGYNVYRLRMAAKEQKQLFVKQARLANRKALRHQVLRDDFDKQARYLRDLQTSIQQEENSDD